MSKGCSGESGGNRQRLQSENSGVGGVDSAGAVRRGQSPIAGGLSRFPRLKRGGIRPANSWRRRSTSGWSTSAAINSPPNSLALNADNSAVVPRGLQVDHAATDRWS